MAVLFSPGSGAATLDIRGGLANVLFIREQAPLPETADELCAVARDIGAEALPGDVAQLRLADIEWETGTFVDGGAFPGVL